MWDVVFPGRTPDGSEDAAVSRISLRVDSAGRLPPIFSQEHYDEEDRIGLRAEALVVELSSYDRFPDLSDQYACDTIPWGTTADLSLCTHEPPDHVTNE